MTREKITLFDTTLRDGQQTPGIDFSVEDKIAIAACLMPSGSIMSRAAIPAPIRPIRPSFPRNEPAGRARFTAFGMTKRAGVSASNDPGSCRADTVEERCRLSRREKLGYHVEVALGCTNDEYLDAIRDSVEAVTASGKEAWSIASIFFDGYKAIPIMRSPAPRRLIRPVPAGWCSAIPMAARNRRKSARSSQP